MSATYDFDCECDNFEMLEDQDVFTMNEGIPGPGVPAGGSAGQILQKHSSADYDTEWTTPNGYVPAGGTVGQYLRKESNTDYDADWDTLTAGDVAFNKESGYVSGTVGRYLQLLDSEDVQYTYGGEKELGTVGETLDYLADKSVEIEEDVDDLKNTLHDIDNSLTYVQGADSNISVGSINLNDTSSTSGYTRIHNMPMPCDIHVTYFDCFGPSNASKLLEVSINDDGTANIDRTLFEFTGRGGYASYEVDFVVHRNHYIGIYCEDIRYNTGGTNSAFSVAQYGVYSGNNLPIAIGNYLFDFRIIGDPISVVDAIKKSEESLSGKLITVGPSDLTTSQFATKNRVVISSNKVPVDGILSNIKCYVSEDGQIDIYKFRRVGTSSYYRNKGFICSVPVEAGLNDFDCYGLVEEGDVLAAFDANTTQIGYLADNNRAFQISSEIGNPEPQFTGSNGVLCLTYTIKAYGTEQLSYSASDYNGKAGCLIDTNCQTDENMAWTTGWANFTSSAANSSVYYNKPTGMDEYVSHIRFTLGSTSTKFAMCQYMQSGYYVSFDFINGTVNIHRQGWSGDPTDSEYDVVASANISDSDITIVTGRDYIAEVEQDSVKTLKVTLTDCITLAQVAVSHNVPLGQADGYHHGKNNLPLGVILKAGSMTIKRFKIYTKMPVYAPLMIFGDSFCEGFNLIRYGYDSALRWPALVRDAFNGNVAISCKGGESTTGLVEKIPTDFTMFHPKHTLIAMSVNDGIVSGNTLNQFKANMTKLIEACRKNKSEPILMTIPPLGAADTLIRQYNSWIRNYQTGLRYLDVDSVLRYEDVDVPDSNYFLPDSHPNVDGNQRIFDMFISQFSDIFSENN